MKGRLIRWGLASLVLALALGVGSAPANADPTLPPGGVDNPCAPEDWFPPWCVIPVMGVVVEDPPPPPIDQINGTSYGEDSDGDATVTGTVGCNGTRTTVVGSNEVDDRQCLETRPRAGGVGLEMRLKTRFTFFTRDGNGVRHVAYGNVRWDVKWNNLSGPNIANPLYRRGYYVLPVTVHIFAYTSNRADAISVHTTVGYSLWGCSNVANVYHYGHMKNHYVRIPNGSLLGPFTRGSGSVVNTCLT